MKTLRAVAILSTLLLAACGGGGGDEPPIEPAYQIDEVLLPQAEEMRVLFTLRGSGFGAPGDDVVVRWVAASGTPFNGESEIDVPGIVIDDGTVIGLGPSYGTPASPTSVSLALRRADGLVTSTPPLVALRPADPARFSVRLPGTAGDDTIQAGPESHFIYADAGDDEVDSGAGDDYVVGASGRDTLTTGSGSDIAQIDLAGTLADDDTVTDLDIESDMVALASTDRDIHAIIAAFGTIADTGPGGDVVIRLASGGTVTFQGIGTGSIDSLADLLLAGVKIVYPA